VSIYSYVALVGLWRSSNSYLGNPIWKWLAKAVTVIGLISQIIIPIAIHQFGSYYLIGYVAVLGLALWGFHSEYKVEITEPSQNNIAITPSPSKSEIDENLLWTKVSKEFESNKNEGLWTKCFVETNGDENKAKVQYLSIRFNELLTLAKVFESTEPIAKAEPELTLGEATKAPPLNISDDGEIISSQISSGDKAAEKEKTFLYVLIAIPLLVCLLLLLSLAMNSPVKSTKSQLQPSAAPQSTNSNPLIGHKWRAWDKEYSNNALIRIIYVDEDSIKKTGFLDKKFEVIFAYEAYGKPFMFPVGAKDKNGNIRNIFLEIYKAEYDCKNKTEKIISNQFFDKKFGELNQTELFNYDLRLGETSSYDNSGGSFLGNSSVYKICFQLYPN
jgi:hypothetical protein